jgi:immunoglobulin-binding protein 1
MSYQSLLAKQVKSALSKDASPIPQDAANRRATKIAALKLERALKTALDEFRQAARAKAKSNSGVVSSAGLGWSSDANGSSSSASAGALINDTPEIEYDVLVLPKRHSDEDDEDEEDIDADEAFVGGSQAQEMDVKTPSSLRSYLLMLCHLHALLAINALDSTYTELELLMSMPSNAEALSRERAGREKDEADRRQKPDEEWKLDQRWGASNTTPLLDGKGKPQRPFTILPGGSSTTNGGQASMGASGVQNQMDARQQLRNQVFQPSHRLPTMSIDEYLEEEQRRGNIISGGGQASADAPTSSELLALRSQGHRVGTREADEADEEQRRKAINWDEFEENNPKGMGNTMNRG